MPRLPTSLLRRARSIDSLLPPLLGPCRDLGAAQNELRWLREHVASAAKASGAKARNALLTRLVRERARGKPLQYILGSEFFGDLEIQCRPGVLIPRQETAASITHLAHMLRNSPRLPPELRVLDLCTGTGCIPLLFGHELLSARSDVRLRALGVDVSERAVALARRNLRHARRHESAGKEQTNFLRADVLVDPFGDQTMDPPSLKAALNFERHPAFWDVLISNPPYVSPSAYWKTTTRSVRGFEPKRALVPPAPVPAQSWRSDVAEGDEFYPRLLAIARDVEAKIVLFEVADLDQAVRVASMARELDMFDGIEVWRDQPDQADDPHPSESSSQPSDFPIIGAGNGRSVLCWRNAGTTWLGRGTADADDAERVFGRPSGALHPSFVFNPDVP